MNTITIGATVRDDFGNIGTIIRKAGATDSFTGNDVPGLWVVDFGLSHNFNRFDYNLEIISA